MKQSSGIFLTTGALASPLSEPMENHAVFDRFHARGVVVVALGLVPPSFGLHPALHSGWTMERPREIPPRPGLILRAARDLEISLERSWLIGTTADDARAAAQAGLAGCVLLGGGAKPPEDLGIVVAEANDLADAPRVMIPRKGGCWHE